MIFVAFLPGDFLFTVSIKNHTTEFNISTQQGFDWKFRHFFHCFHRVFNTPANAFPPFPQSFQQCFEQRNFYGLYTRRKS